MFRFLDCWKNDEDAILATPPTGHARFFAMFGFFVIATIDMPTNLKTSIPARALSARADIVNNDSNLSKRLNENRLVVFGGKSGRYQSDRRHHWSIDPLHECRGGRTKILNIVSLIINFAMTAGLSK
jgi:hypothetical protein